MGWGGENWTNKKLTNAPKMYAPETSVRRKSKMFLNEKFKMHGVVPVINNNSKKVLIKLGEKWLPAPTKPDIPSGFVIIA